MRILNKKIIIFLVLLVVGLLVFVFINRKQKENNITSIKQETEIQKVLSNRVLVVLKIDSDPSTIKLLLDYLKNSEKISYNYVNKESPAYKSMYSGKRPTESFELLTINSQTEKERKNIIEYISKNFPEIIQTIK